MTSYAPSPQGGLNLDDIVLTNHFITQAATKGFTAEQIAIALTNPRRVTGVTGRRTQRRYCGGGVAVIMCGIYAITLYADGIITPMRPDQVNKLRAERSARLQSIK